MSEKSLYEWLNKKMGPEWDTERIENCSNKGIPDLVVRLGEKVTFIELKDWQGKDKHPLSIEQKNFIDIFGGCVVIRDQNKDIIVCRNDLGPLMSGDLTYARKTGTIIKRSDFNPEDFITAALGGRIL